MDFLRSFFSLQSFVELRRALRIIQERSHFFMAEYMTIEKNQNVEQVGIPDDEDDEVIILPEVS